MQIALALAFALSGTVVDVPPIEKMVERSDVVAHGIVKSATVVKEDGKIFTRTTVEIKDGIKGAKEGDTVVISQLGGLHEGRTMWIAGNHKFHIGEEMIFFAVNWRDGMVVPFGIGFGIFDIVDDGNGRRVLREAVGDVIELKKTADGTLQSRPSPREAEDVEVFKSGLKELVAQGGATKTQQRKIEQLPRVRR